MSSSKKYLCGQIHYQGKWEGGWALEIEMFLGPVKWHRAVRQVPFWAQTEIVMAVFCRELEKAL
jgi:hypothetical protein